MLNSKLISKFFSKFGCLGDGITTPLDFRLFFGGHEVSHVLALFFVERDIPIVSS